MEGLRARESRVLREVTSGGDAASAREFAEDSFARHRRQARFAPLGESGQARLRASSALVVGLGALGSHLAETLLRAGVGRLELIDRDVVELQNLQRQSLYDERDAREACPKAIAAERRLRAIDGAVEIQAHVGEFDAAFWVSRVRALDVLLDATDNFATRYLLNDLAVRDGIPWVHGAVVGTEGQSAVVLPGETPCLRCLLDEPPAGYAIGSCETIGVLEPAVAAIAALQSIEALKILAGRRDAVTRGLTRIDLWNGTHQRFFAAALPRPECASCGTREFPSLEAGTTPTVVLCGRDTVQIRPARKITLDLDAVGRALADAVTNLERTPHLLRISVDGCRIALFADARALVFGTSDPLRARALYDRWIGAS